jgi:hypothetical protein
MWLYSRIFAAVPNEAALVAEAIALPRDVDLATELGFNYPQGPLAMADHVGLDVMRALLRDYDEESKGDQRFQPSPRLPAPRTVMGIDQRTTFMNRSGGRSVGLVLAALLAVAAGGCRARTIDIRPADGPAGGDGPVVMDWSDWGLTLSQVVAGDRVDYERLLKDRRALDRFLSLVGRVGPQTAPDQFADRDRRLAYAVNCYNATILRSVVELADSQELPYNAPLNLERRFLFRIDGRLRSPADLRRMAETLAGDDWRVRLALCDGRQTGPPLYRRVLLGELLDGQLNRVTRSALSSPQVVRIDHGEAKQLLVWRGLHDIRERLVREYEQRLKAKNAGFLNVLLEWSDRPRREVLNSAVGYAVAPMPADHRLNALDPPPAEDQRDIFSVLKSIRSFSFLRPG